MQHKTYTRQEIELWHEEYKSKDPSINALKHMLPIHVQNCQPLQKEFMTTLDKLRDATSASLQAKNIAHVSRAQQTKAATLELVDEAYQHELTINVMCQHALKSDKISDIRVTMDLIDAEREKGVMFDSYFIATCEELKMMLKALADAESALEVNEKTKARMKQEPFLFPLTENTTVFFNDLHNRIKLAINEFEYQHPNDQSVLVRCSLHKLKQTAVLLESQLVDNNARIKYEQLLGLVYRIINDLQEDGRELVLSLKRHVLSKHLFDKDEVLNEYNVNVEVTAIVTNEIQLRQHEKDAYDLAIGEYNTAISNYNSNDLIYQCAQHFRADIEKEKRSAKPGSFDLKYFTKLLTTAATMLANKGDPSALENFMQCLQFNSAGKENRTLRYKGLGLMLIGACVIGGGIALCASTFGIATPITFVVAGLGAAILVAGAIALFVSRRKGVEKSARKLSSHFIFKQEVAQPAMGSDKKPRPGGSR